MKDYYAGSNCIVYPPKSQAPKKDTHAAGHQTLPVFLFYTVRKEQKLIVYIASPITTYYDGSRYDNKIKQAREYFPNDVIIPAREAFEDTADWKRKWPNALALLDVIVFFSGRGGWIGAGVYKEVYDCLDAGKEVFYLSKDGDLFEFDNVRIKPGRKQNPYRFARIIIKGIVL